MSDPYRAEPSTPKPFTESEVSAGYRRLGDGFTAGSRCDPLHKGDGVMRYGGSPEYNTDVGDGGRLARVYRPMDRGY